MLSNQRELRGGMIGAGAWSEMQLSGWAKTTGARIVALCDRHPNRRDPVRKRFGIEKAYEDVQQMLNSENLDFVDICVRPYSHAQLVRAVADHGLPILCQKPFCRNLEEARQTAEYCERRMARLMINENYRWQDRYRQAKRILEEGVLGDPFTAQIFSKNDFTRPPFTSRQRYLAEMEHLIIYEVGVHYLDSLRYLFGEPLQVYARTHRVSPLMKGEDVMVLVVGFGTLTALVQVSWATVRSETLEATPQLSIEGSCGTLCVTSADELEVKWDDGHERVPLRRDTERFFVTAALQHFVDCLNSGEEFETSGRDNLKTMALAYACYRSANTGHTVEIVPSHGA